MKTCLTCKKTLPLDQFGRHAQKADGRRSDCKVCNALKARQWGAANKDKALAGARRWVAENPERRKAIARKSYEKHQERYAVERAEIYRSDPETAKKRVKEWVVANPEQNKKNKTTYRHKNRAMTNAKSQRYRMENATPHWLTAIHHAQMQEFYEIALARTTQTGVLHHVDHIHPLRGNNFHGLHVPWNLQVLTRSENLRKGALLIEVP
jgi:hypothetical protein